MGTFFYLHWLEMRLRGWALEAGGNNVITEIGNKKIEIPPIHYTIDVFKKKKKDRDTPTYLPMRRERGEKEEHSRSHY